MKKKLKIYIIGTELDKNGGEMPHGLYRWKIDFLKGEGSNVLYISDRNSGGWKCTMAETIVEKLKLPIISKNTIKERLFDMEQKLSREELVDLVETIISIHDKKTGRLLTEEEHCRLVVKFKKGINHPGGSDLIYYPELVGLPDRPTVDEIVDLAMKGISSEK